MSKTIQFNLRIPKELKDSISEASAESGRSINAEAQFRLEQSFAKSEKNLSAEIDQLKHYLLSQKPSKRSQQIAEQLNFLLEQTNQAYVKEVTIPQIAYELGYDRANTLEEWFLGLIEPTFENLKKLSRFFSSSDDWLCFFKGYPYASNIIYTPSNNLKADLLKVIGDCNEMSTFIFVRSNTSTGEVLIIRLLDKWYFETINTPIELNNHSSPLNFYQKTALSILIKYLSRYFNVASRIVEAEDFEELKNGLIHPSITLRRYPNINWALPFSRAETNLEYWGNWVEMCEQIKAFKSHCDLNAFDLLIDSSIHDGEIIHNN